MPFARKKLVDFLYYHLIDVQVRIVLNVIMVTATLERNMYAEDSTLLFSLCLSLYCLTCPYMSREAIEDLKASKGYLF